MSRREPLDMKLANDLLRRLAELPNAVTNRIARTGMRRAVAPLRQAMRELAPKDQGDLGRAVTIHIKTKRRVSRSGGKVRTAGRSKTVARIGPRKGAAGDKHAHFVEYGTAPRRTKSGHYTGAARAKPFIRPAFQRTKGQVMSILRQEVEAALREGARK